MNEIRRTVHELDLTGDVHMVVEDHTAAHHPPRRAVMLLHGFTGDASTMGMLADPLAADHRVIAPNLIGHGGSSGPDLEAYAIDSIVGQLLEVLDALGVEAAVDLVGYSMGGRVALTLACRHPLRVRTMTLIGATAGLSTADERAARVAADETLAASIEEEGVETFVDRWMANPLFATQDRLGEAGLSEMRAQRLRNDGRELARSLRAAGTGSMAPLHDAVTRCPVPTTFVVGGVDAKFRAIAESLAPTMRDAEVAVVAGAGHAAHVEEPAAVVALVRDRLSRAVTVDVIESRLPLRSPMTTATGTTEIRHTVLYGLTESGSTGWGEAAPLPGWSPESLAACRAVLPRAVPAAEIDLEPVLSERTLPARAAVVGAALDLRATQAGVPLRRYLADTYGTGEPLEEVAVNGVVSALDPGEVAEEVIALAARGIAVVKLKVATAPVDVDVARVAAARVAAPDATIHLDANGGWVAAEARTALARMAAFDIALCEEPVRGVEEIAALAVDVDVPLAVDESVHGLAATRRVWAHAGAIAAVVIKPQAIGGDDLALVAIAEARRAGLGVIVTTMIDSAVGVAHAAHVAAAARLAGPHGLDTARLLAADVADPLPVVDGRIRFPDRPGLGIGTVSSR